MQRITKIFSPTLISSVPLQRLHTRRQMVIRQRRSSRNTAMPHLMSQCSFSGSLISKLPIWIPNNSVALFIWFCWENPQSPRGSFFIEDSWTPLECCRSYLCLCLSWCLAQACQCCSDVGLDPNAHKMHNLKSFDQIYFFALVLRWHDDLG